MSAEIAIVVSARGWAEQLHRFVADHGGARVRARILDGREAVEEHYDVLVAEDLTSFLTPRLVAVLQREGRRVLGVYDPAEPWGRDRLERLGVDETIGSSAAPEDLLRAVDTLAATTGGSGRDAPPRPGDPQPAPRTTRGGLVAVGGPAGGPGITEVAIGLATALVHHRRTVAVVDVDDVAPSVAQRLGLALHPNLRTAVDVVHHLSGRLVDCLLPTGPAGPEVLGGLSSTRDWTELRPGEVVDVLRELSATRAGVICDVGHRLEEVAGPATTHGRHGLARAVVATVDLVVGVCAPTPVGLARFLDWLADVRVLTGAPVHVVVNRAPTRGFARSEVEGELRRTYAPPTLVFVPHDRRVEDAGWAGGLPATGPFTRALDDLARRLLATARPTAATGASTRVAAGVAAGAGRA